MHRLLRPSRSWAEWTAPCSWSALHSECSNVEGPGGITSVLRISGSARSAPAPGAMLTPVGAGNSLVAVFTASTSTRSTTSCRPWPCDERSQKGHLCVLRLLRFPRSARPLTAGWRVPVAFAFLSAVLGVSSVNPVMVTSGMAQQSVPVLRYSPPPNTSNSALASSADYSFSDFNASVQIYAFRRFDGNLQAAFQTTLLREWIDPMHREQNVATTPTFQPVEIPGAASALMAQFLEGGVGRPMPHMRMLIVAQGQAAIVDASASSAEVWQRAVPSLNAMAATLRVESGHVPPPLDRAVGANIAGLYMGWKAKYTATFENVTGYAEWQTASHFYLFSTDGRVYRAYDGIDVRPDNIERFDFDAAARVDPANTGYYTVDGESLIIQFPHQDPPEMISAPVPVDGRLIIDSVPYSRQ